MHYLNGFNVKVKNAKIAAQLKTVEGVELYAIQFIKLHDQQLKGANRDYFDKIIDRFGRSITIKQIHLKPATFEALSYAYREHISIDWNDY